MRKEQLKMPVQSNHLTVALRPEKCLPKEEAIITMTIWPLSIIQLKVSPVVRVLAKANRLGNSHLHLSSYLEAFRLLVA